MPPPGMYARYRGPIVVSDLGIQSRNNWSSSGSNATPRSGAGSRSARQSAAASMSPQLGCWSTVAMCSMHRSITASAIARMCAAENSRELANRISQFVVRADQRQEPRTAVVERDRGKAIVHERVIDRLTCDAPGDERAERRCHRDPMTAVASSVIHIVQLAGVRQLIVRERDVSAPGVINDDGGKRRKDMRQTVAKNRRRASRRLRRRARELRAPAKQQPAIAGHAPVKQKVLGIERHAA